MIESCYEDYIPDYSSYASPDDPTVTKTSTVAMAKMWECKGRTEDKKYGGFLYQFEMRGFNITPFRTDPKELERLSSDFEKESSEIYPAGESHVAELGFLLDKSDRKCQKWLKTISFYLKNKKGDDPESMAANWDYKTEAAKYAPLRQLGYSLQKKDDTFLLTLPDREALMGRLASMREKLKKKGIELPHFDIVESNGLAGDREFVLAYLQHDMLMSNGEFFVHDHFHARRLLAQLLGVHQKPGVSSSYSLERKRLVEIVSRTLHLIDCIEEQLGDAESVSFGSHILTRRDTILLLTALSNFVDILTNYETTDSENRGTGSISDKTIRDRLIVYLIINMQRGKKHFAEKFKRAGLTPSDYSFCGSGGLNRLHEIWPEIWDEFKLATYP